MRLPAQTAPAPQPDSTPATPSAQAPVVTATAQGGTVRGTVVAGAPGKPGAVPLPGVAVTATNTLTGRKYAAATDVDGVYTMKIPRNGRYVLRAELSGFAAVTAEVLINGEAPQAAKVSDFGMQLASRAAEAEARASSTAAAVTSAAASPTLLRGLQNLSLNAGGGDAEDASTGAGNTGTSLPSLGNLGDASGGAADTVAVSGAAGRTNGLANFSEDEIRDRIQQGVEQARANGQIPQGVDPTNAIVGILGSMMAGGPGGPGGGGRGGAGRGGGAGGFGRGSGGFRNMNPTQLHGGFNYSGEYAALDSAPWSPTLQPQTKQSYSKNSFGGTLAGSPYIPGLIKPSTKQFFFLNFNVARNTSPVVLPGTVPTSLQRGDVDSINNPAGNAVFTGLTQTVNGVATPITLYDPTTGLPFANNIIPRARLSAQALRVLQSFYPEPDPTLVGQAYNYETNTTSGQNSANLSARFIRNLGANNNGPFGGRGGGGGGGGRGNRTVSQALRQSLNANFSYSHSAQDQRNIILPLSGATQSDGYNLGAGYVIGKGRLNDTLNLTWNRSHALTRNYFTNTGNDPNLTAGIALPYVGGVGAQPNFYNGLASLSITNFTSITNTNPQDNIGQTISVSEQLSWRHAKHNFRFGVDVRRVHQDYLGGGTPLGSFTFTGLNTESPTDKCQTTGIDCPAGTTGGTATGTATSGSSFADFLLGLPQQSQLQAGLSKIYLRENVADWYVNDDFRVANGFTLNGGLRYEYFGPFSEKNNRLVNLTGVSTGTTSVSCVTPNGLTTTLGNGRTLTCAAGPNASLIHPDRAMYSPRFGFAYRPQSRSRWLKETVLRGGYGLNFNTSQFSSFARSLSYQPPFAATENNVLASNGNVTGCNAQTPGASTNLTLANGFGCSTKLFTNTFAVNPFYRLGLVQVYNLDLQRSLPLGIQLNVGYNGSHGSNLNVTRAPNHTASTVTTPDAVAFTYQDSTGESTFNALTVSAQKRLQKGIQLGARYQYAHSIDDASSFGGATSTSSIQNDADLHAERSNSSFDVRHSLTGNWIYELPVGPNRAFLSKGGVAAKVFDGFSLSGSFTITSGAYFTPSYQSTAAQIAAGGTYTLRPDRVFTQSIQGSGALRSWFNSGAFVRPDASGSGYGTASRYSIQGPGQLLVTAALSRTVQLGDTRSFEGRVQANNVFNTVQYSGINTTLDSASFGQVTGAASMRQLTFVGRFRF